MPNPITTSQQSPDTLPIVGYTVDQLRGYIKRQLGEGIFTVELTNQQILDLIQDSLTLYSVWRPRILYGALALQTSKFNYLEGVDLGLGPVSVSFVQPYPLPQALFWGNLVGVAPLVQTGIGEYDMYLRWQKMWARVSSVQPDWVYDEINKVLMIYNPVERWRCGVVAFKTYDNVSQLDLYGADWVKKHAFQKSRAAYAEIMNKFSGAIPGPIKDQQLDQQKQGKAEAKVEELEKTLQAAQISMPLGIDAVAMLLIPAVSIGSILLEAFSNWA